MPGPEVVPISRRRRRSQSSEAQTVVFVGKGDVLSDRYELVREIARGAMGVVYEGKDQTLDGYRVAIKVLPPELAGDEAASIRMKREAISAKRLTHQNLMRLDSFEQDARTAYLVMEYLDGENLSIATAKAGRLPLPVVAQVAREAAAGLQAAHDRDLIHRDVKPANLMFTTDAGRQVVKVTDFGIAYQTRDSMTRLTSVEAAGTLLYCSPEQLRGKAPKAASDQYSLAVSLYEMLAGDPPFRGPGLTHQILEADPEPIGDVPDAVNEVLRRGLAKDADARYPSITEFADAFAAAALGATSPEGAASRPPPGPDQGPDDAPADADAARPGAGPDDPARAEADDERRAEASKGAGAGFDADEAAAIFQNIFGRPLRNQAASSDDLFAQFFGARPSASSAGDGGARSSDERDATSSDEPEWKKHARTAVPPTRAGRDEETVRRASDPDPQGSEAAAKRARDEDTAPLEAEPDLTAPMKDRPPEGDDSSLPPLPHPPGAPVADPESVGILEVICGLSMFPMLAATAAAGSYFATVGLNHWMVTLLDLSRDTPLYTPVVSLAGAVLGLATGLLAGVTVRNYCAKADRIFPRGAGDRFRRGARWGLAAVACGATGFVFFHLRDVHYLPPEQSAALLASGLLATLLVLGATTAAPAEGGGFDLWVTFWCDASVVAARLLWTVTLTPYLLWAMVDAPHWGPVDEGSWLFRAARWLDTGEVLEVLLAWLGFCLAEVVATVFFALCLRETQRARLYPDLSQPLMMSLLPCGAALLLATRAEGGWTSGWWYLGLLPLFFLPGILVHGMPASWLLDPTGGREDDEAVTKQLHDDTVKRTWCMLVPGLATVALLGAHATLPLGRPGGGGVERSAFRFVPTRRQVVAADLTQDGKELTMLTDESPLLKISLSRPGLHLDTSRWAPMPFLDVTVGAGLIEGVSMASVDADAERFAITLQDDPKHLVVGGLKDSTVEFEHALPEYPDALHLSPTGEGLWVQLGRQGLLFDLRIAGSTPKARGASLVTPPWLDGLTVAPIGTMEEDRRPKIGSTEMVGAPHDPDSIYVLSADRAWAAALGPDFDLDGGIWPVSISPGGTSSKLGEVRQAMTLAGELYVGRGGEQTPQRAALSADGRRLAAASRGGEVVAWVRHEGADPEGAHAPRWQFRAHASEVVLLRWVSHETLLTVGQDGTAAEWTLRAD